MMGLEDGVQQGVQQGVKQGVQQGVQQGIKIEIIDTIKDILQFKFNVKDAVFLSFLQKNNSVEKLRKIKKAVMELATLKEIEKFIKKMEN